MSCEISSLIIFDWPLVLCRWPVYHVYCAWYAWRILALLRRKSLETQGVSMHLDAFTTLLNGNPLGKMPPYWCFLPDKPKDVSWVGFNHASLLYSSPIWSIFGYGAMVVYKEFLFMWMVGWEDFLLSWRRPCPWMGGSSIWFSPAMRPLIMQSFG